MMGSAVGVNVGYVAVRDRFGCVVVWVVRLVGALSKRNSEAGGAVFEQDVSRTCRQ